MNQTTTTAVTAEEQRASEKTFNALAKNYRNNRIGVKTFLDELAIDEGALVRGSGSTTIKTLMASWEGTERDKRQGVIDLARNQLTELGKLPQAEEPAITKATASPNLEEQVKQLSATVEKLQVRIEQLEAASGKKERVEIPAQ